MKTCRKCNEEKTQNNFYPQKGAKDGLFPWCKTCQKEYRRKYLAENKEVVLKAQRGYRKKNKEKVAEEQRRSYRKHRKVRLEKSKEYQKNNPEKVTARNAKRKASKLQATPPWLTVEQLKEIESFYWLCKDLRAITGEEYHVDHIVPLQSKTVCGLHVPWNLQVLPWDINISKGIKYDQL